MQANRAGWGRLSAALVCALVFGLGGCGGEQAPPTGKAPAGKATGATATGEAGGGGGGGGALSAEATVADTPEETPLTWLDKEPMDVQSVRVEAREGILTVTVTLDRAYAEILDANKWGTAPVEIYLDTDDNAATGAKTFMGDMPGFEYTLKPLAGVELEAKDGGEMQVYEGGGPDDSTVVGYLPTYSIEKLKPGQMMGETIVWGMDKDALASSKLEGHDLIVKVPYARVGLKAGQAARLLIKESQASGFPKDVYLPEARILPE